jgi:hypothetical protein
MKNCSDISLREQANVLLDDDDICIILDQHA